MIYLSDNSQMQTAFNMPCAFRTVGALNQGRLLSAVQETIGSFATLRSRFLRTDTALERSIYKSPPAVEILM